MSATPRPEPALTVEAALERILAGAGPDGTETVALENAEDRVLAERVVARLTQPPFDASAMDGYAVRAEDVKTPPVLLDVIGESAAGRGFHASLGARQAVRIFTGAPLPPGADAIIIQENTEKSGSKVIINPGDLDPGYIRKRGFDFTEGQPLLDAHRLIGPREITLAAAAGHAELSVFRRPRIAILATGDELVTPGTMPGLDQIVCSNSLGIAAMARRAGAIPHLLGIARDTKASLEEHVARAAGADILVTVGGASVGDHDLVAPVLTGQGMSLQFWKILMRPGKPLMFGRLGPQRILGLPGNPVSSLICARVFLMPLIHALAGRPAKHDHAGRARLAVPLSANGARQHYMRAISAEADGVRMVRPVRSQDSSLLSPLAEADCLIVRPPGDPALAAGAEVAVLPLDI